MEGSHLENHHSTTVAYGLLNNNAPAMKVAAFHRFWEESEGRQDLSILSNCHISFPPPHPHNLITSPYGGVDSLVLEPHLCSTIVIVFLLLLLIILYKNKLNILPLWEMLLFACLKGKSVNTPPSM
jgi:hypothetical protein